MGSDGIERTSEGMAGVVASTLMSSKITHRADVNPLSQMLKNKILKEFKGFIWKGKEKKPRV